MRALEEKGIGRPSTYAPTISTILPRGYVARENKRLIPDRAGHDRYRHDGRDFADIVDIQPSPPAWRRSLTRWKRARWTGTRRSADFYGPFEKDAGKRRGQASKRSQSRTGVRCALRQVRRDDGLQDGPLRQVPRLPQLPRLPPHDGAAQRTSTCPARSAAASCWSDLSRKGRKFYGCERYPECDFVSWEMPGSGEVPGVRMATCAARTKTRFPRLRERNLPPSRARGRRREE